MWIHTNYRMSLLIFSNTVRNRVSPSILSFRVIVLIKMSSKLHHWCSLLENESVVLTSCY